MTSETLPIQRAHSTAIRTYAIAIVALLISSVIAPLLSAGQTPTFKVLVLDALNGKPQPGVSVEYFCPGQGWKRPPEVKTGPDGAAEVPYACKDGEEALNVFPPGDKGAKEECGGGPPEMKLSDIMTTGIISEPTADGNIWCPAKQRRKLKPVPGQVTIFVKKPTWWQSHIAG
jgi:hypothetical protein